MKKYITKPGPDVNKGEALMAIAAALNNIANELANQNAIQLGFLRAKSDSVADDVYIEIKE